MNPLDIVRSATRAGASALLAIGLSVAAPLPAQDAPVAGDTFDGVRGNIRRLVEDSRLPSVAVAVAKDGVIVWEQAWGWADRERRRRATPETMYSLASISKPITATAIMRLVESGMIDLDRPANDYLAPARLVDPAGAPSPATVRQLLSHTAGLPLHYQFFYEDGGYAPPPMDETIRRYGVSMSPPGDSYQYSNVGYGVLDHIVARVSGRSYAEFVRDEVLAPLGLHRSSVDIAEGLGRYAAVRYDRDGRPIPFYGFDHVGASAVWGSAGDLVRFGMVHLGERVADATPILGAESRAAMQRIETPGPADRGYGLGWSVDEDERGYRRVSHSGGMPGVSTMLSLYPSERLVVVVLSNTSNPAVVALARQIAAAVLPGDGVRVARSEAGSPGAATEGVWTGSGPPPDALRGDWAGHVRTHEGTVPLAMSVRDDGAVEVRLGDERPERLAAVAFRNGSLLGRFDGTIPTADASRHPHQVLLNLTVRDDRLAGQATAISTTDPIHFALSSYAELERR